MTRSKKRYLACIFISIAAFSPTFVWGYLIQTSHVSESGFPILATSTVLTAGGFVAREKGRWIGGWLIFSLLWPLFVVLCFLPYEEYRRDQLNGTDTTVAPESGIELKPSFPSIAFLFFFVQPRLIVDGTHEYLLEWREKRFFPLAPGEHTINLYVNYLGARHGKGSAKLDIANNQVRRVYYFVRPLIFTPAIVKIY